MGKVYVGPLSINLLASDTADLRFEKIDPAAYHQIAKAIKNAAERGTLVLFIGHRDTASVAANTLGVDIDLYARQEVKIEFAPTDVLYVFQISDRLPEGTTKLPEGVEFSWWMVTSAERREYSRPPVFTDQQCKMKFIEWYDNGTGYYDAWRVIEAPSLEEAQAQATPNGIVLPSGEDPNAPVPKEYPLPVEWSINPLDSPAGFLLPPTPAQRRPP